MSRHCCAESVFRSFLEIASATAVNMHFNTTRHHSHTLHVNDVGSNDCQVAVGHFQYLVVTQYYTAILEPPLWGQDAAIDNLCKHIFRI